LNASGIGVKVGVWVNVGVKDGVDVGVIVNVAVEVGVDVGVYVIVGVDVTVGVEVNVGPNNCPGLQLVSKTVERIKIIEVIFHIDSSP
jgi:hypothetical protein